MRAFAALLGRHDNETLPCLASGESVPLRWVEGKKTTCRACWAKVRVHRKDANGPPCSYWPGTSLLENGALPRCWPTHSERSSLIGSGSPPLAACAAWSAGLSSRREGRPYG